MQTTPTLDPTDLRGDYSLMASNRAHNWVTYGNWDLPFGPGKLVGSDTSGWLSRVIEGWQMGWITSVASGSPLSMTANSMLYANGTPDMVNEGFDPSTVGVYWPDGDRNGSYFANRYSSAVDPVCSSGAVAASIQSFCTLNAVKDVNSGNYVLVHPAPGKRGTLGRDTLTNIMRWSVDMSMSKSVRVTEGKSFRIRVDASNIFNHPFASGGGTTGSGGFSGTRLVFPVAPVTAITSGTFGAFPIKVGGRTFQFMARFDF